MVSRVLLLLSTQRWTRQIRRGYHWITILGIVVLLSPVNAISNSGDPSETVKRESRRLRSGPHNFNHSPYNVNYNRMNSGFSHPSSLRGPLNNHYHNNNDLSASAQTLYDLRGFHIPLAGQEETQRFLRQQNHLQQQQPDHQTTPLVFPSFFQPQQHQQRHETQPQAINIFGHNQHHQQTHRFRLQENENSFRPSQPDLGVTTTTENVFRPIQPAEAQLERQDQQKPTDETPSTEEVYVYDDADYQFEQEQPFEKVGTRKSKPISTTLTDTGNNAVEATVEEVPEEVFQVQQEPQTFRFRELQPVTPNQFFKQNNRQPKNNLFNIFETQSGNEISSQIHTARPNVEIVPSSERKPPDHVDTISPPSGQNVAQGHTLVYENENRKSRFPARFARPPPSELPVVQEFPILQQEPLKVFQAPPKPQLPENSNLQTFQRNPYQQSPLGERNQQRLEEPFQEVTTNAENEEFFQNEPIIIQKINPHVSHQERFRPPQRIRPANVHNPQIYLSNPQPTQYLDEEEIDEPIKEIVTTNPPPLRIATTTTTTTEIPKNLEVKSLRPFSIRNRVPTVATTTSTTSTTTTPTVKRKFIRPRIKPTIELTTTTTTAAPIKFLTTIKQVDNYESGEIESPKFIQQNKPAPTIRSRGTPIRSRTTTTAKPQVTKLPVPRISVQRELQFQRQYETPSSSPPVDSSPEIIYEPRNRPGPAFQDPRFHQNEFDTPPFHVFNDNFSPEFPIQHGRQAPQPFRYNNNQPRFRPQPPPPMFTGKPLYITGKMLGKEGGLYAGQTIPPGHNYGNPIPLFPVNTVFERNQYGVDGRVGFQQNPQISVSSNFVRQRQNIPRITGPSANDNNRISPQQQKTLISNVQEREENSANVLLTQRTRLRPPIRRKIRPNSQHQQVVQSHRDSDKPSNRDHDTEILLTTNEVNPSAPPRLVSNPPRRRPKRPRIQPAAVNLPITAPDEQAPPVLRQPAVTKSPKIRPRIRSRQHRPTSVAPLNTPQSLISDTTHSPTVITQSSVQIFRKPTEAPGRFSSRYRDENVLSTPTPTLPTSPESIGKPQQESTANRRPAIKIQKNLKIQSPTVVKQSPSTTSTESVKPKPNITARPKSKELEVEDGLPPSIYLSPKDVLTNRKPARRIPPGSYSDRIKALQARRKNNKLRGTPNKENQSKEVQQSNSEDEEDDEVYSQSSNIEQVQNKREISTHRHKTLSTQKFQNDVKVPDSNLKPDLALENSTEANSEETMSVLGIPQPNENSQLDSPQLISLSDEDGGETEIETQRPLLLSRPEGKDGKTNKSSSLFFNNDLKYSTKSPFNIFTMSTEEPSLPLEAYFPIVSQQ